jgi:predicted ATP-dependent endonuclease of OLD family
MKPCLIEISNFRSIKLLTLPVIALSDGSRAFGLIGVNEAGKSSILKAIALTNINNKPIIKDFQNTSEPITITITYSFNQDFGSKYQKYFEETHLEMSNEYVGFEHMEVTYEHLIIDGNVVSKTTFRAFDSAGSSVVMSSEIIPLEYVYSPIFWTADDKYLINSPIELDSFAANPDSVSVPLKNCFNLAGYTNIIETINNLKDSTDIEYLQDKLGLAVTNHLKNAWPGHPVKITFSINDRKINLHIKDEGSLSKAKTTAQRSDGFKQFISFLLTVSAENKNKQLSNSFLLIDEPETHLHPQAQQYFLDELKDISKKERNNIVLFATHSTFMIDQEDLSRNFRVIKINDETNIKTFHKNSATYNAVNFEVFEIYSTGYHNELYSQLHAKYMDQDLNDSARESQRNFDKNYFTDIHGLPQDKPCRGKPNLVTLPTYIRNCINHAENGNTYKPSQLEKSTDLMRQYLLNIQQPTQQVTP